MSFIKFRSFLSYMRFKEYFFALSSCFSASCGFKHNNILDYSVAENNAVIVATKSLDSLIASQVLDPGFDISKFKFFARPVDDSTSCSLE